jgi:hypothetical protein
MDPALAEATQAAARVAATRPKPTADDAFTAARASATELYRSRCVTMALSIMSSGHHSDMFLA